ncbi:MAG: hypothetical protein GYA52_09045 [Chloroflexi bacterium]|nr:hypothetical protein [Chloroflexota bacterium]
MTTEENPTTPFEQVLAELQDENQQFSPKHLRAFSDMDNGSLEKLKHVWADVPLKRKISLLEDLEELMEADTLVCCDALGKYAMTDTDAGVRRRAINLLWECEDSSLIPRFMDTLDNDPEESVRAAAAAALGKFILLGELDEIDQEKADPIIERLLAIMQQQEDGDIPRRALESLGYSSHKAVAGLIEKAMRSTDNRWVASALFAMGRSLDERWEKIVLQHLNNEEAAVQIEAVRAAGELELSSALETLFELLDGEEADADLLAQIYWALSKIGGKGVREKLEQELEDAVDEDLMDILDMALENLEFTEDSDDLDLFDIEHD